MFRRLGGRNWVWNIILAASLFAVPFFVVWSLVNSVAWYYQSTQALPFTTILLLMIVWLLVGFPLNVLGGILGKNMSGAFDAPCRTKNISREIPPSPWYRSMLVHMAIGGFLPFRCVCVCVCACGCVCVCMCACVCMQACVCACRHVCVHACV